MANWIESLSEYGNAEVDLLIAKISNKSFGQYQLSINWEIRVTSKYTYCIK